MDQNSSNDPYYFQHFDSLGLVLVSQIFIGENYASWSRSMNISFSVKNKLEFIDGILPKPHNSDPVRLKSWTRNNNIIISWLLNSISNEIYASMIYLDTVVEIWKDLKEHFQQGNDLIIFEIKRDLMNHVQGQDSVNNYFAKLKGSMGGINKL